MARKRSASIVKSPVTWILVADAGRAQVYTRSRIEKRVPMAGGSRHNHFEEVIFHAPSPVSGMKWEAEQPDQYETGRNRTGMVFESFSSARHVSAPRMDARKEVKQHFATAVAGHINKARTKKRFDRLVLIAPPRMLGEIKKHLDEKTLKTVVAEMPKDLTRHDAKALANHLSHIG